MGAGGARPSRAVALTGFLRPKPSHGFFFFDGRVERISTDAGVLTRTRLGASLQTDEMRLLPYVRTEHGNATAGVGGGNHRAFIGLATFVMPRARWGSFLSQTLLRTNAEIERQAGLGSWAGLAAHPLLRGVGVRGGAQRVGGGSGLP